MHLVDILEDLSNAAFAIDDDARITCWSAGAKEMLGYSAKDTVGQLCGDVLQSIYPSGEPMCSPMCDVQDCIVKGKNHVVDACLLRHKDGHVLPTRITSIQVDAEGSNNPAKTIFFMQNARTAMAEFPPEQLRIYTLGHFSLVYAGKGVAFENWKRKQALTLLKFLIGRVNHPTHREELIKAIWPDVDIKPGWDRLKVTISLLRSELQQCGVKIDPVLTIDQSYMLRGDVVWIDFIEFERLVKAGNRHLMEKRVDEALAYFEDANRLYRGDFLEGDPHSDASATERERLREVFFDMLAGMAKCQAAKGDHQAAAKSCQRALYRDHSRESFLRGLIDSLGKVDRSTWKKSQLDIWQRVQGKEFDMVPKPEHLQIYEELLQASKDNPESFE